MRLELVVSISRIARMRLQQIESYDWSAGLFCHWTTLPLCGLMLDESSRMR